MIPPTNGASPHLVPPTGPAPDSALPGPTWLPPILLLLLAALVRWIAHVGAGGADDLFIAAHAIELVEQGPTIPYTPYGFRVGLTYPLAGVFHLLGIGFWQLALLPLLYSLLGVWLAWRIGGELFGPRSGLAAGALLALMPLDAEYGTLYFPDLPEGVMLALSAYLALTARRRRHPAWWAVGAGVAWGMAYLIKEEAPLFVLVLLLLAVARFLTWSRLLLVVVGFCLVLGAETWGAWHLTGRIMPRLAVMIYGAGSIKPLIPDPVTGAPPPHVPVSIQLQILNPLNWLFPDPPANAPATPTTAGAPTAVESPPPATPSPVLRTKGVKEAAFSARGLEVLPKAWFITFYEVGLYYWFLVAAVFWAVWRRVPGSGWLLGWLGVYLVWLEFGGNPLHAELRTHLIRYCNVVNVPLVVLVGAFLTRGINRPAWRWTLAGLLGASSLFFINFNTLNWERPYASQLAVERALEEEWFPLYADAGSLATARFMFKAAGVERPVHAVQRFLKEEGLTEITRLEGRHAHVLLNRDAMRQLEKRYGVARVTPEHLGAGATLLMEVDNPLGELAYAQARLLVAVGRLLPVPALREKIASSGEHLLEGQEAEVYRLGP